MAQGAEFDIFSAIALDNLGQVNSLVATDPLLQQRLGFAMGKMQPLHYAIELHKNEITRFLIHKGADLQAKTRWGITPLCLAREKENQEIIQLLSDRNLIKDLGASLVARQWAQAQNMVTFPAVKRQGLRDRWSTARLLANPSAKGADIFGRLRIRSIKRSLFFN